ncbi:MAG TPA: hypothetical protein VKB38_17525 [Terracidiphilus sp.]|nr:hypothetical protein [Terracidiphilus sp.]
MQSISVSRAGQDRLLVVASLWLTAGFLVYFLYLPSADDDSLLRAVPLRLIPMSMRPLAGPFLTLAITVAILLACVWTLRCTRDGAFLVCGTWALVAVAGVIGTETGFWGRFNEVLPGLSSILRSLHDNLAAAFGFGFTVSDGAIATVGSLLAYLVVLNSIPPSA